MMLYESIIEGLKDAVVGLQEFMSEDGNIQGTPIGNDYVISVFGKAVLVLANLTEPFMLDREDVTEEEQAIIDDIYDTLELSLGTDEDKDFDADDDIEIDDDELDTDEPAAEEAPAE